MTSIILRGGSILDGTGSPERRADLRIVGDRIDAVGDLAGADADEVIDVSGLTVAPGFIDVHSHSDLTTFLPDDAEPVKTAAVRQGVTTEIPGNCGWTPFPTVPERSDTITDHVAAVFGPAARSYPSVAHYRRAMADRPLPNHLAPLVGHGTIRAAAIGLDDVAADADGVARMTRLLEEALDDGAFGLSSGLIYPPGVYSETGELDALAEVLARRGSLYTTHMRNEMDGVAAALAEAIGIGRHGDIPVQISHLKVASRRQWGTMEGLLATIADERSNGVDVAADAYPYTAGSTLLRAILPPWINEGGIDAMLARLDDPSLAARIAHEFETGLPGWQSFAEAAGWEGIVIANAPARPDTEGRSIAELAAASGRTPVETVASLLVEMRGDVMIILHMMAEEDVRAVLANDDVLIGSDTIPLPGKPHPRTAGTFGRMLGHYTRDEGLTDLPTMVKRMTSLPAERFNLARRGRVTVGYAADLVVFDAATVADRATFADPLAPPCGVHHVFVDGTAVVVGGDVTDARPGRVLEPGG